MLMLTCIGFRPLHLEGSTSGSAALITSTAGAWGDWGNIQNCAHANVLTGAQIRSESPRKLKTADDTAGLLNNRALLWCSVPLQLPSLNDFENLSDHISSVHSILWP